MTCPNPGEHYRTEQLQTTGLTRKPTMGLAAVLSEHLAAGYRLTHLVPVSGAFGAVGVFEHACPAAPHGVPAAS
jgi:hypothetical protein